MKKTRLLLSFILVGLLCVTAQADISPGGFQGIFGDAEAMPLEFTAGLTSGTTVDSGISASFDDLLINLTNFAADGDAVMISNLVLIGIDGCDGVATYVWDDANLSQMVSAPQYAFGAITGTLALQDGSYFTTALNETVIFPESIAVTLTYNGLIVTSNGTNGSALALEYSSASFSAVAVPEPSTIICLLVGFGTLLIWRRK